MKGIKKFLVKIGVMKAKPHEKAELGQGTWGRQPDISNIPDISASARPKGTIKMRVYRAKTNTWEDIK